MLKCVRFLTQACVLLLGLMLFAGADLLTLSYRELPFWPIAGGVVAIFVVCELVHAIRLLRHPEMRSR